MGPAAAIAVAAERTRIAREMHDVVAHSLAVMVTLSDAAVLKIAAEPERAAQAMRDVSASTIWSAGTTVGLGKVAGSVMKASRNLPE